MSAVHGLLSKIPERLSFEQIIVMAHQLFEKHPPKKLARNGGLKLSTRSGSVVVDLVQVLQTLPHAFHAHMLYTLCSTWACSVYT